MYHSQILLIKDGYTSHRRHVFIAIASVPSSAAAGNILIAHKLIQRCVAAACTQHQDSSITLSLAGSRQGHS
jgi:hypothetical protein